jgi:hypothetical protein
MAPSETGGSSRYAESRVVLVPLDHSAEDHEAADACGLRAGQPLRGQGGRHGPTVAVRHLKGAQTRSCSLSVLMEEAAEQIASVYSALVILAKDGQLGRRVWRLQ